MGEGGRKVEMAGAEETVNEDEDGALVTDGADDVEGVGVDLAGGVLEPSEKKSTGGAADFWGCVDVEGGTLDLEGPSVSRDTFTLPFLREGGRKDVDGVGLSTSASFSCLASTDGPSVLGESSWSWGRALLLEARNTNPGPPPPPRTRSSFSITGTDCFGAGSILRREDFPAPVAPPAVLATRGFFAGGLSSSSSGGGRDGRLMAIFLVRFCLGGAALARLFV